MPIKRKIDELTSWMNWNYIGFAAGVLSVVVTVYNIGKYWDEIRKVEKQ